MIGFNGGLIGAARETSTGASVPGVWTPREQLKAKRASLWPPNAGEDPYFANVSLLLRGDGTNGSTTILDESFSPKTVTAYGDAQISTAQSKYGGSSIAFDGSGDYLQLDNYSSDFSFGTGDYTVEMWCYASSVTSADIVGTRTTATDGWVLIYFSGALRWVEANNTTTVSTSSTNAPANTWNHIAVSRSSNTVRLFVNGTQRDSASSSATVNATNLMRIGYKSYNASSVAPLNGYIDDFRITKGVARYTSNFTPPGAL